MTSSPTPAVLPDARASLEQQAHEWRKNEVQAIGAAISNRSWHAVEQAYNSLRDKMDRAGCWWPPKPTPPASDAAVPAGRLRSWRGGDAAPADWDGGPVVLRDGGILTEEKNGCPFYWNHTPDMDGYKESGDIIAYTAAAPKVASDTGAGFNEQAWAEAVRETDRHCYDLDITNADHIVLWLEHQLNGHVGPLAYIACRILDAHETALATPTDATDGATAGGEVVIKPLHWHEPSPSASYPNWTARNFHTQFEARIDTSKALKWGKFPLSINGNMVDFKFDTVEQAKAYAQAEYETRMRQLLSDVLATTPGGDLLEQAARECRNIANNSMLVLDGHDARVRHEGIVAGAQACERAVLALKPAGDGGEP